MTLRRLGLSRTWSTERRKLGNETSATGAFGGSSAIVLLLFIACVCWLAWPAPGRECCRFGFFDAARVMAAKSGCQRVCVCARVVVALCTELYLGIEFLLSPPFLPPDCRPSSAQRQSTAVRGFCPSSFLPSPLSLRGPVACVGLAAPLLLSVCQTWISPLPRPQPAPTPPRFHYYDSV